MKVMVNNATPYWSKPPSRKVSRGVNALKGNNNFDSQLVLPLYRVEKRVSLKTNFVKCFDTFNPYMSETVKKYTNIESTHCIY